MASDNLSTWLPPFYDSKEEEISTTKVVNTTGAGNAFQGGFILGYSETLNFIRAACYGSIAASFALEQIGVPHLQKVGQETGEVE